MSSKKNKNKNKPRAAESVKGVNALKAAVERGEENEKHASDDAAIASAEDKITRLENAEPLRREDIPVIQAQEPQPAQKPVMEPASDIDGGEQDGADEVKEFIPRGRGPKPPAGLSANIGMVLGGDEEIDEESAENEAEQAAPAKRPNKLYLIFALFIIAMSVIGVISTVRFCIDTISDIANQTDLKNELAVFLYPVVSVDPPDCASADELPATIVLESAIWRIILKGENSNYERLSNTYMYVPAVDVEFSVRAIYGNSAKIEHQTVGSIDTTFTYMKDLNSYVVPVNPFYTAYTPYIRDVSSVGELYTVTVDYIIPSALNIEGFDYESPPAKTMCYTLSKRANGMTLHSIKNITTKDYMYE